MTMGYEAGMQADILALLRLFAGRMPDPQTHAWVVELAADRDNWESGHDVFDRVRTRNIDAIDLNDHVRECQYCFEEVCLMSLYNETDTLAPFDSCSPYWVIKNAIALARVLGMPVQDVIGVVAPGS
jgi:hypothetical protein